MHPVQIQIFTSATPQKKIQLAMNLYHSAKKMKAAGLRKRYPEWSEEEIQKKVKEIFLYART